MNRPIRRRAFGAVTAAAVLATLAACGKTPAQWAADAAAIVTATEGFDVAIAAAVGIPQATVLKANGYLTSIISAATTIAAAVTAPAATVVQELENGANALLPIAEQYLSGTKWVATAEAIVGLLPEFLALAGVVGSARVAPRMTIDQARRATR